METDVSFPEKLLKIVAILGYSRVRLIGQASTAYYSSTGTHLDLINCITTFSGAILPILPKIALKLR